MKVEFPNIASEFVALTHYCRFIPEENRRETWSEVIDRVVEFLRTNTEGVDNIPAKVWHEIRNGMATFNVMPSMRLVATAGPVAARDNVCCYNCSYIPIDSWQSFSELLFILMCFHPDTMIKTNGGSKKISDVTVDDFVLTYDENKCKFSFSHPLEIIKNKTSESKLELTFNDGSTIRCTKNHKFLTSNRGWVEAQNLGEEDDIKSYE